MDKKRIEEIAGEVAAKVWHDEPWCVGDINKFAHALIARLHAEAVPEGWQLVPKVATPEMLNDMNRATHVLNDLRSARAYEAALSAAPQPPITTPPADERDAAKRWNFIEQHWSAADIRNNKDGSFKSMTITFKSAQLSDQINRDKLRKGFDAAISSNKEQS